MITNTPLGDYGDVFDYSDYFADYSTSYDFAAIVAEHAASVNDALPPGYHLTDYQLYGPHNRDDVDLTGYPLTEDGDLDLRAVADTIDFDAIVQRHQKGKS